MMAPTDLSPFAMATAGPGGPDPGASKQTLREERPQVSSMDHEIPHPTPEFVRLFREQDLVCPLEPKYRCVGVRGRG